MSFQPIGFAVLILGVICWFLGPSFSAQALLVTLLLGSAAAVYLPALGGSSIQPAHLLLVFLCAGAIARRDLTRSAIKSVIFPQAGFWLAMTVAYGVLYTFIAPRLFAGATYVFVPASSDTGGTATLILPLAPVSANITQSVYMIGNLFCFILFYAYASRPGGYKTVIAGGILCSAFNLVFVVLDLLTYYTNTSEYLFFMRNTTYRMLDETEVSGLKRIVGSFSEASVFAYATLSLFAFNLRLWIESVHTRLTGLLLILSLLALLFCTSSTGYLGLLVFATIQYIRMIVRLLRARATENSVSLLLLTPIFLATLIAFVVLNPSISGALQDFISTTLLDKLSSDSGIERSSWNKQALTAFQDTMWLGAGMGSLRASSWIIAVPASIGAIGATFYVLFSLSLLGKRDSRDITHARAARLACQDFCLSSFISASISVPFVDLGLGFFAYAGLACAMFQPPSWDEATSETGLRNEGKK